MTGKFDFDQTLAGPFCLFVPLRDCDRQIPLPRGRFAIVDAEDFERASKYRWQVKTDRYGRQVVQRHWRVNRKRFYENLHRFLMGAKPGDGQLIDHVNGNVFDARRSINLRVVTNTENIRNSGGWGARQKSSRYKGVYQHSPNTCWRAQIEVDRRKIQLGRFPSERQAAHAYDLAALRYFGEYARLNFPLEIKLPEAA